MRRRPGYPAHPETIGHCCGRLLVLYLDKPYLTFLLFPDGIKHSDAVLECRQYRDSLLDDILKYHLSACKFQTISFTKIWIQRIVNYL